MYIATDVVIRGSVIEGFFTDTPLSELERIDLAVKGYQCHKGYLIFWGDTPRAYLYRIPGMPAVAGTVIISYLSL